MELDKKDFGIIEAMNENSRLSFRKIAKKCHLSVATVMHHVKRLEKNRIIKKYSVQMDYDLLGFDLQAIIEVNVVKGMLFEVEKKIATHPNVSAVYDVTGDYDALILAKFRTRRTLDNFLKKIQTYDFVTKTKTIIILNVIKEDNLHL